MTMPQDDGALIGEITTAFGVGHQYLRSIEEWNDDLVAQIRRSGRAAGRALATWSARSPATRIGVRTAGASSASP